MEQKDLWMSRQGDVSSETLNCTREHWGQKALAVGSGRVSSVCVGTLGQGGTTGAKVPL